MKKRLHLHLGAHKTATTSFQKFLLINSNKLLAEGVRDIRGAEFRALEAYRLISHARALRSVSAASIDRARDELTALLSESGASSFVFSNEGLIGQHNLHKDGGLYPGASPAMDVLAQVLSDFDVTVSFVIRPQPAFLESTYLQALHYANYQPFREYLSGISLSSMSWTRVIAALDKSFGKKKVFVVPFEIIKKGEKFFYIKLLEPLLGDNTAHFVAKAKFDKVKQANASLSHTAVKILDRTAPLLSQDERKTMVAFLREHFSNQTHPRAVLLNDTLAARLLKKFSPENAMLFDRMGPEFEEYRKSYTTP